jgi:hypothetical protein
MAYIDLMQTTTATPVTLSCADTAKIMRSQLKTAFPGVKFSVRSSLYSMGSSITVRWTDGPTREAVDAITDGFAAKWFDGLDDSTHYNGPMTIDGRLVQSGASYIHTSRHYSPAFMLAVAEHVVATTGGIGPEISLNSDGTAYIDRFRPGYVGTVADRVYDALQTTASESIPAFVLLTPDTDKTPFTLLPWDADK